MPTNIFSLPTEINALLTIGGTDNVAVTSTGNVGIGTTSPSQKLTVSGNVDAQYDANNYSRLGSSSSGGYIQSYSGGTEKIILRSYGDSFFNGGNVGIGTTSPYSKLTVRTESASHQIFSINRAASDTAALYMGNDASTHAIIAANNSDLRIGKDLSDTFYEYVRVKDGGNVGIGTTSPGAKLEVFGTGNTLRLDSAANGSKEILFRNVGTGTATIKTDGDLKLYVEDAGKNILFDTTGGEKMRIQADGYVGIGTTDAQMPLQVVNAGPALSGTASYSSRFIQDKTNYRGVFLGYDTSATIGVIGAESAGPASNIAFWTYSGSAWGEKMRITGSGNVGIANSDPDALLDVGVSLHQNATGADIAGGAGGANVIGLTSTLNHNWLPFTDGRNYLSAQAHTFRSADHTTDWMHIAPTGNVGIGTTSPTGKLHVATPDPATNFIAIDFRNPSYGIYGKSNSISGRGNTLEFTATDYNSGGAITTRELLTLRPEGNVGIGTTSPGAKLDIAGGGAANTEKVIVSGDDAIIRLGGVDTNGPHGLQFGYDSAIGSDGMSMYYRTGPEHIVFENSTGTSGSGLMVIQRSGNVGIGNTSPGYKLDVTGSTRVSSDLSVGNIIDFYGNVTPSSINDKFSLGVSDSYAWIQSFGGRTLRINDLGNDVAFSNSTTRVGIGTSSPGQKLVVAGGTNGRVRIKVDEGTNNYGKFEFSTSDSGTGSGEMLAEITATITDSDPNSLKADLSFSTNSGDSLATAMTIRADRFVRIGNTAASNAYTPAQGYVAGLSSPVTGGQTYLSITTGGGSLGDTGVIFGIDSTGGSWYHRENKPLRLYTQSIERMRIAGDGNVGIGNTAPTARLSVTGVTSTTEPTMKIQSGTSNVYGMMTTYDAYHGLVMRGIPAAATTYGVTAGDQMSFFEYGGQFRFYKKNTTELTEIGRIDSTTSWFNSNFGIGTSSPGANLQIGSPGADLTQDLLLVKGGGSSGNYGFRVQANNSDELFLVDTLSYNTIISNGNVGIGTTSPSSRLHVYGGDIRLDNGAGDGFLKDSSGNNRFYFGTGTYLNSNTGGPVAFQVAGSEKMRVNSDGNVGIGTTSPSFKLHVVGDILLEDSGTPIFRISDTGNGGGGGAAGIIQFSNTAGNSIGIGHTGNDTTTSDLIISTNAGSTYGGYLGLDAAAIADPSSIILDPKTNVLVTNGNVGIGTTSPSEKLEVNGNVKADNFIGGNAAGIYSFNDTVTASTSEDIFSISNNHGAQSFRVTFVCNTTAYSVAKTFEVVHSYGNDPIFFKVVDTGGYGVHDFDVSFTNSNSNTGVTCSITNNSTTINADIVTTVFLGGSPTVITVTAL